MADPLRLAVLRLLSDARQQHPPVGWLLEQALVDALCPKSRLPAGAVKPGHVGRERRTLEEVISELRDLGAVDYEQGHYRLTRVGVVALAGAEAEAKAALRRPGES